MPRVYVVNNAGHDIRPVHDVVEDAEIVALSEGNVNIFNTDRVIREFKTRMLGSAPEDFLLLSGSIAINLVAFGIAMERHGVVNLLIWHAKDGRYVPRTISKEEVAYGLADI